MQRSGIEDKRSPRSLDSVTLHRGYLLLRSHDLMVVVRTSSDFQQIFDLRLNFYTNFNSLT